jgi:hypothetical protein
MEQQTTETSPMGAVPLDCKVRGSIEEEEQSAFEDWLEKTCPSGDVSSVQYQWVTSHEYAEFCDEHGEDAPDYPNDVWAAAGGMAQTAIER